MASILRPILVGGGLGIGFGVATAAATVIAPALTPKARQALISYLDAVGRARQRASGEPVRLVDLTERGIQHG